MENKTITSQIHKQLQKYPIEDVGKFAGHIVKLLTEKNKDGNFKNIWIQNMKVEALCNLFERVSSEGLVFDGIHITLQSTGISYDYVAYKNKMLIAYPETMIDLALVYEGDDFKFSKHSGNVVYKHEYKDPFNQLDDKVVGGYCVIKNKRGEFLTIISKEEIEKHRKVARTDYIWKAWFKEMCMKTIVKKACKIHFDDIYKGVEDMDNENYDLNKNPLLNAVEELQQKITDALEAYQGEDADDIRKMCAEKLQAKEFTVEFGENILKQLTV